MKKYEEYKEYLYDWLPTIPKHWQEISLRGLFYLSDERKENRTDLELLSVYREFGVIPKSSRTDNKNVESENTSKYKVVHKNDLVINKMKLWQGSLGISRYEGFVSPAYIVAHCNFDGDLQFLNLFLRSPLIKTYYNRISYGIRVGQWDSDFYSFKQLVIPVPPHKEQEKIVQYLDWQVSNINHLIHGYQKQIKLLQERRQTIIDRAATQGINPNVQYKDSGATWIPQIPEHWNMVYSKKLFAQRKDKAFPNDIQLTSSQKYGIISQDEFMKREGRRLTVVVTGSDILKHVGIGDFVISMRGFQGGLEYSYVEGKISSAYVMLIPNKEKVYDEYFKWLLKSKSYIKALQGTSDLVRDGQALRYANFAKVYLPEIPLEEQKAIADYINSEVARIDNALPTFQKKIELLREYRTRLISDVVTGQIDVRDVVIPEYTPEDDTEIDVADTPDDTEEVAEDAE
mgnify:FL=1